MTLPAGAVAALGIVLLTSAPALAHHGWAWTTDDSFTLEGTVTEVYFGNPHPVVHIEAADGVVWEVELAPPARSAAAGFTETTAEIGDSITAVGNRSQDPDEPHMKAVRLIVDGVTYDVYPDRTGNL